eukprot:SAG11_NODE_1328_length_5192_cov_17.527783_3_plen_180_part_00
MRRQESGRPRPAVKIPLPRANVESALAREQVSHAAARKAAAVEEQRKTLIERELAAVRAESAEQEQRHVARATGAANPGLAATAAPPCPPAASSGFIMVASGRRLYFERGGAEPGASTPSLLFIDGTGADLRSGGGAKLIAELGAHGAVAAPQRCARAASCTHKHSARAVSPWFECRLA